MAVSSHRSEVEDSSAADTYLMADQLKRAGANHEEIYAERQKPLTRQNNNHIPPTRSLYASMQRTVNQFWILEIVSCLISIIAFILIISVLATEKGRVSPEWPHHISINTIIAILTAIMKAAMLLPITESISQLKWLWYSKPRALTDVDVFDAASRGTWGSFLFLLNPTRRSMATAGALLMIAALAIDPFSQQVIKPVACSNLNQNSIVQVPKTQQYLFSAGRVSINEHPLDTNVILAVQNGLIATPVSVATLLAPSCPSGNCTFISDHDAAYASLAMCHTCTDLTGSINTTIIDDQSHTIRHEIPSGAAAQDQYIANVSIPVEFPSDNSPVNVFGDDLFVFETVMLENNYTADGYNAASATRCSLYPCAKVYASSIVSSRFNETALSNTRLSIAPVGFSLILNETLRAGVWESCNATTTPDRRHTVPVANGTVQSLYPSDSDGDGTIYFTEDCVFVLSSVVPFQQYLYNLMLNQTVIGSGGGFGGSNKVFVAQADLVLQSLFKDGNATLATIDEQMTTLDNYLTYSMRAKHNDTIIGNQPAVGNELTFDVCIEVEWAWLSLPASLLLLTIGFLALTIARTIQMAGKPGMASSLRTGMSWKSSQLPLLFFGLDNETRNKLGSAQDVTDMEEKADTVRVRLEHSKDGAGRVFTGHNTL